LIPCRLCGSPSTKNLGKIPDCGEFAGRSVTPSLNGGYLMRCVDCRSLFRSPVLSQAEYMNLYQHASDALWESYQDKRIDFDVIRGLLSTIPGGRILDIGCYSGLFLKSLPVRFEKFGIEPSGSASLIAQSHGIDILGKTCSQIDPDQRFDIVVAIDVVEHVTDIDEFMEQALRHVRDGGLLIISTGNPDCVFWNKVFRGRFWYSSFSEHLTFPSVTYFASYCKRVGLADPLQIRFSYLRRSVGWKLMLFLSQIVFFLSPATFRRAERRLRKMIGRPDRLHNEFGLSAAGLFTDHHVVVIKKPVHKKNDSLA
jgi:SAM-dependent methyltransferase